MTAGMDDFGSIHSIHSKLPFSNKTLKQYAKTRFEKENNDSEPLAAQGRKLIEF